MLHYDQLIAPARHGGVLVAPSAKELASWVQLNASDLRAATVKIGARSLAEWRRATRARLLPNIPDEVPVLMVGHQPGLIHAGVWAKNVVAHRLAAGLSGAAVHLSVDSDAPNDLALRVPIEHEGRWYVRSLPLGQLQFGRVYEQIPSLDRDDLVRIRIAAQELVGSRFEQTPLPEFCEAMCEAKEDWVAQINAGRRAVERNWGIGLIDLRVRDVWWSPLAGQLLTDARQFARHYNEAIALYRRRFGVRSVNRPVPPLQVDDDRVELPFWLFESTGPRDRAFLADAGSELVLHAGSKAVLSLSVKDLKRAEDLVELVQQRSGWRLRPRALVTTLWSRFFLADLFIHGIGGAKYDRITDILIERYFGLAAPRIACVTATLYLDRRCEAPVSATAMEQELREMIWNPQRHAGSESSREFHELADRKLQAIARSATLAKTVPGDRTSRKAVYDEIRGLNQQMAVYLTDKESILSHRLERLREERLDRRALCDREVFFGLHSRESLDLLLAALPAESDFVSA